MCMYVWGGVGMLVFAVCMVLHAHVWGESHHQTPLTHTYRHAYTHSAPNQQGPPSPLDPH